MTATLTDERPATADQSSARLCHLYCPSCPDTALCGGKLPDTPDCPESCGCVKCAVCYDLDDVWPCPACGAEYDCEAGE